jgi:hypothetical protein
MILRFVLLCLSLPFAVISQAQQKGKDTDSKPTHSLSFPILLSLKNRFGRWLKEQRPVANQKAFLPYTRIRSQAMCSFISVKINWAKNSFTRAFP